MIREIETKWLVVGGGPAGALCSRELARQGEEVLCLFRSDNFRKPCGGGIRIDAFERFELDPSSILSRVDTFLLCHRTQRVRIELSPVTLGIVDRLRFDRLLRHQAKQVGAGMMEATFRSVKRSTSGYEVLCSHRHEKYRILCHRLVAADGVLSPVRRALTGKAPPSILTHYTESPQTREERTVGRFRFGHSVAGRYYAWDFPGPAGRHLGTLAGSERLRRFLGYRGISSWKTKGYRIPLYQDPLLHRDGICFAGDAAGQVLPFTYEGIYYALAAGELLAKTLGTTDNPQIYEEEWQKRYGRKFRNLKRLEQLLLRNGLTVTLMMKLLKNPSVQKAMLELWIRNDRSVPTGLDFYFKALSKIFGR